MAITITYPRDARALPGVRGGRAILRRLVRRLGAGLRRVQYARMVQALNELPDHQLAAIGLDRAEIPAHARRLIHGDG